MEEKELRITYGMTFKIAGDIIVKQDLTGLSPEDIAVEVAELARALAIEAMKGQGEIVSEYNHLVTAAPASRKLSGYSGNRASGGSPKPSGGKAPTIRDPQAPASEKQVALATRLYWSKEHDLDVDPNSFEGMSMGEISNVIDTLMNA